MQKGEKTRADILAAAVEMASIEGLSGLTIGGLAATIGLSKSGLFSHFGSKEALQTNTLEAAAQAFVQHVVAPSLSQDPGLPQLRSLFHRWIEWAASTDGRCGCPFVAAATELDDRETPARDYLVWAQGEWLKILARSAERAVAAGQVRHDLDTRQLAHDVYAVMLGFHHAKRLMRDPKAELRARNSFDTLIANALR